MEAQGAGLRRTSGARRGEEAEEPRGQSGKETHLGGDGVVALPQLGSWGCDETEPSAVPFGFPSERPARSERG